MSDACFLGGKACFFAHGKCEKWKNSIDNITGGVN